VRLEHADAAPGTAPDKRRWQDFADPFILHFAGGKPWRHRSRPKTSYWWAYARASPLKQEIVSQFWSSRGRNFLSTIRSKALAPVQMAIARQRLQHYTRIPFDSESKAT
jgi:lipopolysaccharide biosynthesis glycosyltransferase